MEVEKIDVASNKKTLKTSPLALRKQMKYVGPFTNLKNATTTKTIFLKDKINIIFAVR